MTDTIVDTIVEAIEAIAAAYCQGAKSANDLIVLCGVAAHAEIVADIKRRYKLMHELQPTLAGEPPEPFEITGVRVLFDPNCPPLMWRVQPLNDEMRLALDRLAMGEVDESRVGYGGSTIIDGDRTEMSALASELWGKRLRDLVDASEQEDRDRDREARQCGWDPMGDY